MLSKTSRDCLSCFGYNNNKHAAGICGVLNELVYFYECRLFCILRGVSKKISPTNLVFSKQLSQECAIGSVVRVVKMLVSKKAARLLYESCNHRDCDHDFKTEKIPTQVRNCKPFGWRQWGIHLTSRLSSMFP